jgi:hypothetical protein
VLLLPRLSHSTGLLPSRSKSFSSRRRTRTAMRLRNAAQTVSSDLTGLMKAISLTQLGCRLVESHATALLVDGDDDASIEYIARPKRDGSQPPTPTEERGRSTRRLGEEAGAGGGGAASPSSIASSERANSGGGGGFFRNASTGDRLFAMSGWRSPSTSMSRGRGSNSGTTTPTDSRAGSRSASRNR